MDNNPLTEKNTDIQLSCVLSLMFFLIYFFQLFKKGNFSVDFGNQRPHSFLLVLECEGEFLFKHLLQHFVMVVGLQNHSL